MLIHTHAGSQLLRVQVYEYLREQMSIGILEPGSSISVKKMTQEIGVSRTPLREALLLLQVQGFVTILPQRGVKINKLTFEDTRHIYQILSALESGVILTVFDKIGHSVIEEMKRLNEQMAEAIEKNEIDRYYRINIDFHDLFLKLSDNERLLEYVRIQKMLLYDFPGRDYGTDWNIKNIREHEAFVELIEAGDAKAAADYMRDVHWEFSRLQN